MEAARRPSTAARVRDQPKTGPRRHHHQDDGNGHAGTNGWSAHVRYFLARYPPEARDFVAQRLAAYGIRSLLSSNRMEDLTLDTLLSATDPADRDMLSLMRQHARGRREQRGGFHRSAAPASPRRSKVRVPSPRGRHQPHAIDDSSQAPREALRERGITRNTNATTRTAVTLPPGAAGSRKRHEVVGRPDVLTRYPFVDDLGDKQGGGVGAAMYRATPTTPIQYLAKREIRRLAHEAFRELKASALGIRLSDLPCALQFLFFGDSASLLTAKGSGAGDGGGSGGGDGGGVRAMGRSAKDVHLVMALARECLPPTLAHAARDTSTLSSASTQRDAEAGWARDGKNMFISERRWIKIVAHVIRRLWDMDGPPSSFLAARARWQQSAAANGLPPKPAVTSVAAAAGPLGMDFQQPVWRPVGGGNGRRAAAAERFLGDGGGEEENTESFLGGLTADSRSDSAGGGWGGGSAAAPSAISADDADGDYYGSEGRGDGEDEAGEALRAWEEEGEGWVGAGRSLAWASPGEEDEGVSGVGKDGSSQGEGRLLFRSPRGPRAAAAAAAARGRRRPLQHGGGGGGGHAGENWKEGTRPAGMWEVTPPAHVAALRRGQRQGGDGGGGGRNGGRKGGGGPAYLRGVQSRIGPQLDAHKERLRKIAGARRSAVKDVVARRRLDHLETGGGGGGRRDSSAAEWGSQPRGHTPGEHALDIAGAFLESSLMTRLAGGDWFDSEDGFSSVWEAEEAVRLPPRGRRRQNRGAGGPPTGRRGGRNESSRREDGGHDAPVARRRQAYTGWLGDFGPVHTHTVREVADAGDEEDAEEEEDGRSGGDGGGGGGGGGGGSDGRDRGSGPRLAGQEVEDGNEGTRRSWPLDEGGAPSSGGGDVVERSEDTGGDGGVDESTAAVASVAARGSGADATLSGAADSSSDIPVVSGGHDIADGGGGGMEYRQETGADDGNNSNDEVENMGTAETGDVNVVAPLDGGLDAYLQLASDSGVLHGGGGGGLGGGDSGGTAGGARLGPSVGGGGSPGAYTGATSGSWWEEDRSEVATSPT